MNGRRVNIPSYQLRPDDIVSMKHRPSSRSDHPRRHGSHGLGAGWLQADHDNLTGKVLRLPDREEIDTPVQEQLIVELYSK